MGEGVIERIAALYAKGLHDAEIARRAGCCWTNVARWRVRRGLPRHAAPARVFDESAALAAYRRGLNDRQIGAVVGWSHSTVRHWRLREGLEPNSPPRRRGAVVSDAPDRVRALWSEGLGDAEIARRSGLKESTVKVMRSTLGLPKRDSARPVTGLIPVRTSREALPPGVAVFNRSARIATPRVEAVLRPLMAAYARAESLAMVREG